MDGQPLLSDPGQIHQSSTTNPLPRRRGTACNRCRVQKVRCNNQHPACSGCVKAGVECIRTGSGDIESRNYIRHLEKRTRWLEDALRKLSPGVPTMGDQEQESVPFEAYPHPGDKNETPGTHKDQGLLIIHDAQVNDVPIEQQHVNTLPAQQVNAPSGTAKSPADSISSHIGPSQPLAHDVGLLSLENAAEPKYLGPSSGVTFARLIFAAAPQTQGLSTSWLTAEEGPLSNPGANAEPVMNFADLPADEELHYFVDAYFELWQALYPFIDEHSFQDLIRNVYATRDEPESRSIRMEDTISRTLDLAQMFLVLALGAKSLESRLSTDFSSHEYYATAMFYVGKLSLHDSVRGVQILLLLVLSSFSFTNGLNAWFLTSTIIASCLDLGLQRKQIEARRGSQAPASNEDVLRAQRLRSAIFWSAYSLDRTLCVVLGRPLTLRDEGIDIEYPGQLDSQEIDHGAITDQGLKARSAAAQPPQHSKAYPSLPLFVPAIYSFRFDRITAEIKLMIYRVAQSPSRFPWPTNLTEWQKDTFEVCGQVLEDSRQHLKWQGPGIKRGFQDRIINHVELKYHQCIMLIYRPSPAIPQPSVPALKVCYDSAIATIRIQSELHRFGNMIDSWLTAHAVFVSGITMLYCVWTSSQVRHETTLQSFMQNTDACNKLLTALGKTWSVAETSRSKFERLVQLTVDNWNRTQSGTITPGNPVLQPEMELNPENMASNTADGFLGMDALPPNFTEAYGQNGSNMIIDELGDMGSWFDLDWLLDANCYTFQADDYNITDQ